MPKFTPAKEANALATRAAKDRVTDAKAKLAVEVHRLRTKNAELTAEVANLTAEIDVYKADGERRHTEVMQRLEALINTFSFHNNAMVTGLNAQTAVIANLKVGK
jgi:uncharacterized protein YlxW (UPF0749 family)